MYLQNAQNNLQPMTYLKKCENGRTQGTLVENRKQIQSNLYEHDHILQCACATLRS